MAHRNIPILFLLLCLSACQKKTDLPLPAVCPRTTIPDTVTQVQKNLPFVSYTDTFYGAVNQSNYSTPETWSGTLNVYVKHISPDTLYFSTNFFHGLWNAYNFLACGNFVLNPSNKYGYEFDNFVYSRYKLVKDSLYYQGSEEHCPDVYITTFEGRLVSGHKYTR